MENDFMSSSPRCHPFAFGLRRDRRLTSLARPGSVIRTVPHLKPVATMANRFARAREGPDGNTEADLQPDISRFAASMASSSERTAPSS